MNENMVMVKKSLKGMLSLNLNRIMKLFFNTSWIHVVVLNTARLCCTGSEVMTEISLGMMDKEEASWCMHGGNTSGISGSPGGAGVDLHIRTHTAVGAYEIWPD